MDRYYTTDHEWISFQGAVAYTGICAFKLTGFKKIEQIRLEETGLLLSKGDKLATVHYGDYIIEAQMPVDGRIIEFNETLESGNTDALLRFPESTGWIAKISPARPYEREGLMLPAAYQMNGKSKYAKG